MIFRRIKPQKPISDYIDSISYFYGNFEDLYSNIINGTPDGKTNLIINLGSKFSFIDSDENKIHIHKSHIFGQQERAFKFEYSNYTHGFILRFTTLGLYSFFKIPISELYKNSIDLELIDKDICELEEKIAENNTIDDRFQILNDWLLNKINKSYTYENYIKKIINNIILSQGTISLNKLEVNNDSDYKRLQRIFNKYIGLSPKLYSRIIRFDNIRSQIINDPKPDWMFYVAKYGFTDQSHLIKDFLYFTGKSPLEFKIANNLNPDFIKNMNILSNFYNVSF